MRIKARSKEKWNGRIDDGSVLFENMIFVDLVSGQQEDDAVLRHEERNHEPWEDGMHVFIGCRWPKLGVLNVYYA
jgi:hypothetical protein